MYSHFKGRFIQVIESLDMYDACSNHVVHIDEYVRKKIGIQAEIYVKHVHPDRKHLVKYIDHLDSSDEDIVFFHFSAFSEYCAEKVITASGLKVLHYHNITPHYFFEKNTFLYNLCKKGRNQLKDIVNHFSFITGDSNYNLEEIITLGFEKSKTQKLPIIINEISNIGTGNIANIANIDSDNIIFVGRICENKCQHKLIEFYNDYIKNNEIGRLYLVGKYDTS